MTTWWPVVAWLAVPVTVGFVARYILSNSDRYEVVVEDEAEVNALAARLKHERIEVLFWRRTVNGTLVFRVPFRASRRAMAVVEEAGFGKQDIIDGKDDDPKSFDRINNMIREAGGQAP